jgi:hypothetical protein
LAAQLRFHGHTVDPSAIAARLPVDGQEFHCTAVAAFPAAPSAPRFDTWPQPTESLTRRPIECIIRAAPTSTPCGSRPIPWPPSRAARW